MPARIKNVDGQATVCIFDIWFNNVCSFPGATILDMYDYLTPLLKKKPSNVILQVCTNDAPYKSSDNIVQELLNLKEKVQHILPNAKVFLSTPTLRFDNGLANSILREVTNKLRELFD